VTYRRATVAGAGLAGLAAAVAFAEAGFPASLSDSAAQAGGRCRSYRDPALGMMIDNGNHLVLAGNLAVADFRQTIGARVPLAGPAHADFGFADLESGERWTVRVNDGRLPWWVLAKARRVPGTRVADYLQLARLLRAGRQRIDGVVPISGALWERFVEPVMLAVLNTLPAESSAILAGNVLKETLAQGGRATRPRIAQPTLGAAFIDPALHWLGERGCGLVTGRRLKALEFGDDRITALIWNDGRQALGEDEAAILAVPAWTALELVPGLAAPTEHHAIVNGHFATPPPPGAPAMLGILGGTAEWVFAHEDRISVTVSHADRLIERDREELGRTLWADVCRVFRIDTPLPPWQIVKERRATFAATPEQDALRPGPQTRWRNLFLAGDWIQTGLPATIEGALRSGDSAARLAMGQPLRYGLPR
jgi:hydroxysqualene dehydroxylase